MTDAPSPSPPVVSALVNLQSASAPGFAPVGASAEHVGWHGFGPEPMPEVVAHLTARWPDVVDGASFGRSVGLERFDADAIAEVVARLGADELVAVARDVDGVTWWADHGSSQERRDVVGELARAAAGRGLAFGIATRMPDDPGHFAAELADLVERYDVTSVRALSPLPTADGTWVGFEDGPAATVLPDAVALRTWVAHRLDRLVPDTPWELRRGFGPSLGYNRLEADADLTSTAELCAEIASAVARGGSTLLDVPVRADGTVPDHVVEAAHHLGGWLDAHRAALRGAAAFDVAGDDTVRYLARPGVAPGTRDVVIVDLEASGHRSIAHFSPHRYPVLEVTGARRWSQDSAGVHLFAPDEAIVTVQGRRLPVVTTLTVTDRRRVTLSVQGRRTPGGVRIGDDEHPTVTAALAAARRGDVVELGPGRFGPETESFPLRLPAGVTVQGPTPRRRPTSLGVSQVEELAVSIEGPAPLVVLEGADATLRHVAVTDATLTSVPALRPVLSVEGAAGATVEGCELTGLASVTDGDRATLQWNRFAIGALEVSGGAEVSLLGNRFVEVPDNRAAVRVTGVRDLRLDATSCRSAAIGVAVHATTRARLSGNSLTARWHGIELADCEEVTAAGDRVQAMRGIWVAGCRDVEVSATSVAWADVAIGVVDSSEVAVSAVHLAAARVGVLSDDPQWCAALADATFLRAARDAPTLLVR